MTAHAQNVRLLPDQEAMRRFLREAVGDAIHCVAITPDGPIHGGYFDDDAGLASAWAAKENAQGRNVYWTVNRVRRGLDKKPDKAGIISARFVHVDIDPPRNGADFDREGILEELADLELPPSFVLDSGNGLQGFWRLDAPAENLDSIEAINLQVRALFAADACHNIDRLMRLPGSVNYPDKKKLARGRVPALAKVAVDDDGTSYEPHELAASFPAVVIDDKLRDAPGVGPVVLLTADDLCLGELSALRSVIDAPAGKDRSADVVRCAGDLCRAKFSREQALGILLNPVNAVSAHVFDQADPRRAALRAIELGYRPQEKERHPNAPPEKPEAEPHVAAYKRGISAAALMQKRFEPVRFIVDGLLAEGATLFGGKPKIGKSWMAYDFALAIPLGRPVFGSIPVTQGDVLYLALEDSERRLKRRLLKKGVDAPERLTLAIEWPNLDSGCIDELEAWASAVERPVLVIVDVLKMVRGAARQNESLYDADYRALTGLASWARNRSIAVLVVHHVRKMEAEDPLESLSGTNGLTGAADTVMVLKRDLGSGHCLLYVRGRDVEESEKAVRFKADNGTWELIGNAAEVGKTSERQAILDLLREHGKPLSVREISDMLGKNYEAVRKCCSRMWRGQEIKKEGRGSYICPMCPVVPNPIKPDIRTHRTGLCVGEESWHENASLGRRNGRDE